jgi:ribA/ribD-fused uncharacterized protein
MTEKYKFFYGGVFSQWFRCSFEVDNVTYNCAEQYMMQQKASFFGDEEHEKKIMSTSSPSDQKAFGKKVRNFNKEKWDAVARDIVYKGNYFKFMQNKGLLLDMTESKGSILVEASPYDQIWGIGLSATDPRAKNPETWKGTNWLGEVLNKVRDDIENGIYRTEGFGWK